MMQCNTYTFDICSGVENIQAGIGTQAGILIKDIVTFLVGLTWAFAINWKLALTASALLPIMSFLGYINITVRFLLFFLTYIASYALYLYIIVGKKI